ncbi:hypothetical protein ACE38V_18925 [Cytobacillus sp. Hz8]
MKSEIIFSILQKEWKQNLETTSIDIAKKDKLPLLIIEALKKRMEKANQ